MEKKEQEEKTRKKFFFCDTLLNSILNVSPKKPDSLITIYSFFRGLNRRSS